LSKRLLVVFDYSSTFTFWSSFIASSPSV